MTKEEGGAETERMIEGEREKGRDRQTDRQRRERGGKREGEGGRWRRGEGKRKFYILSRFFQSLYSDHSLFSFMMSEYFVPGLFPFGESNRLYLSIIRELLNLCKVYKKYKKN